MCFHRYDVEFVFWKGVNLVIADTLSSAYLTTSEWIVDECHRVLLLSTIGEADIPDIRLQEVRNFVPKDSDLQALIEGILMDNRKTNRICRKVSVSILIFLGHWWYKIAKLTMCKM
jgi:hypothetical protein